MSFFKLGRWSIWHIVLPSDICHELFPGFDPRTEIGALSSKGGLLRLLGETEVIPLKRPHGGKK